MSELDTNADRGESRVRWIAQPAGLHLVLSGEIDMGCRPEFDEALAEYTKDGPSDVTVDLSDVTFLSSDGLGFLVSLHKHAIENGRSMTLQSPPHVVTRVLDVTGLNQLFTISG